MVTKLWNDPEVFCINVPLPDNPLRNLNSYVIRTLEHSLIIDTGFNRPECRDALWTGITELKLDLSKTSLFLTHYHSDHIGLVWDFVNLGIPVYMSRSDYEYYHMLQSGGLFAMEKAFINEGFPAEQMVLQSMENQGRKFAPKPGFPVRKVEDGDALPAEGLELRAIRTPGHTPGNMVLYLPQSELLFSGDHILFDITPNISMWPQIANPLSDYIASLQKIRKLPTRTAFPAHRTSGPDTHRRIDQIIEHHNQRLAEIYQAVVVHPGYTAYDLAGQIKWSARGLGWEQFPPHQRWFAMGETLAHLHHLVEKELLIRVAEEETIRYYPICHDME